MNYQTLLLTDKSVPHFCIQKAAKSIGLDSVSNKFNNLIRQDQITSSEADLLIKKIQEFGFMKIMVDIDCNPLEKNMKYKHGRLIKD